MNLVQLENAIFEVEKNRILQNPENIIILSPLGTVKDALLEIGNELFYPAGDSGLHGENRVFYYNNIRVIEDEAISTVVVKSLISDHRAEVAGAEQFMGVWPMEVIRKQYGELWAGLVETVRKCGGRSGEQNPNPILEDLNSIPPKYRKARALALSVAKWLPGAISKENRNKIQNCGACLVWNMSKTCPLSYDPTLFDCHCGCLFDRITHKRTPVEILNRIIEAYLEARSKC